MYIQPNYNSVNMCGSEKNSGFWKRLKQKALDAVPEATFKDSSKKINNFNKSHKNYKKKTERWEQLSQFLSHPAKNRLIMGATALLTQPTIDYYNHRVDEETREISKNRTIAKIIAGTMVGVAVRGLSYSLVEKMTDIKKNSRFSRALLPNKHLKDLIKDKTLLKNYRCALSTGIAILAMCITNFAIDAPLTIFLTNYFNEKNKDKLQKKEERRQLNG